LDTPKWKPGCRPFETWVAAAGVALPTEPPALIGNNYRAPLSLCSSAVDAHEGENGAGKKS
jgi:hypothetical protein